MADEIQVAWSDQSSVLAPAYDSFAVTPSDSVDFVNSATTNGIARSLYIGTAGNVVLKTERGNISTFLNVTTSFVIPQKCRRVNSTGTTAAGIVALY